MQLRLEMTKLASKGNDNFSHQHHNEAAAIMATTDIDTVKGVAISSTATNLFNAFKAKQPEDGGGFFINSHLSNFSRIFDTITNTTNTTTTINSSSSNSTDDSNEMLRTAEVIGSILSFYYVPILVGTGSLGNLLSIVVFFRTKLRKLTSSYYLAALAFSDTCFLVGLFVQWLNFVDVDVYNRDYFCQFFTFFSSLACFCSDWFVVAFTVERFIAVMYPLKRQTMCTVRRAKLVLLGLTTVGCIHCAPFLLSSQSVYSAKLEATICDIKTEYKEYITLLNYWDTIVVFAVPFTTIAVLNTITGCTVWKFATVRRTLTMQKRKNTLSRSSVVVSSSTSSAYRTTSARRQHANCSHPSGHDSVGRINCELRKSTGRQKLANSSQLKVTKMLLVVSTVFVCLNLPSCVMRIKTYLETNTSANEKTTVVLQYIFQLLFITNFGINFVLYCVSGQNFRKEVLNMFRRVSTPNKEATTVSEYRNSAATGASTRRRPIAQNFWNEAHELQTRK